jgi:2-iminobutanoate/2-iminopropanoate deaminase
VKIGSIVAVSGQAGISVQGGLAQGIADQTRLAMSNVLANLAAGGGRPGDVLSVRVFLTTPRDFEPMNEVYREFFDEPYPARTTVYVGLPEGLLVEIDALAVLLDPSAGADDNASAQSEEMSR